MYQNEDKIPDNQTRSQVPNIKYQTRKTQMIERVTNQIIFLLIKILKQIVQCKLQCSNYAHAHVPKKINVSWKCLVFRNFSGRLLVGGNQNMLEAIFL